MPVWTLALSLCWLVHEPHASRSSGIMVCITLRRKFMGLQFRLCLGRNFELPLTLKCC